MALSWADIKAQKDAHDAEILAGYGLDPGVDRYDYTKYGNDYEYRNKLNSLNNNPNTYRIDGLPENLAGRYGDDRLFAEVPSDREGYRKNVVYEPDGNGGVKVSYEYVDQSESGAGKLALGALAMMGGAALAGAGAGAAGAGTGAASGSAIPTAAELSAAGFTPGGVGIGSIGAAGSEGLGALGLGAAEGTGLTSSLAGGALGAGTYGIPTAAELAAGGFTPGGVGIGEIGAAGSQGLGSLGLGAAEGTGLTASLAGETPFFLDPNGVPMTGPGGIGTASSLTGAGTGAVGYGAGLVGPAAEGVGSLFPSASSTMPAATTAAGTAAATGAAANGLGQLGSTFVPKLIGALIGSGAAGAGAGNGAGAGSGANGFFGGNYTPANETPGMMVSQPTPSSQNQAIAQALLLGNPDQPQFNYAYQQVPDIAKFAQYLQGDA
jgi:hypothetical protein